MIVGALRGMAVTLVNFFRPSLVVQYPEQRPPLPERFRGRLFLDTDICTGCLMCEQACPNGALKMVPWDPIDNTANPQDREVNLYPQVDVAMCTYCGWCEEVCPTSAIRHTTQFEISKYERDNFDYTPSMLGHREEEIWEAPVPPQAPPPRPSEDEQTPVGAGEAS